MKVSNKKDPFKYLQYVQRKIKNKYLVLLSCMFYMKIRVLVCSINFILHFISLVIKFLLIFFKMIINHC